MTIDNDCVTVYNAGDQEIIWSKEAEIGTEEHSAPTI